MVAVVFASRVCNVAHSCLKHRAVLAVCRAGVCVNQTHLLGEHAVWEGGTEQGLGTAPR